MVAFYNEADNLLYKQPNSQFITQERFRGDVAPNPEEIEEVTETFGIPATETFQSMNNGGGGGNFNTGPYKANTNYVSNRSNYGNYGYLPGAKPEETFMDKMGGYIKTGIGAVVPGGNFLMNMAGKLDNFKNLSGTDKAFIEMQMANQEQNIHGTGNLPNQDRYGYNKRSMKGNYSNLVDKRVDIAKGFIDFNHPDADEDGYYRDIDKYYNEKKKEQKYMTNQMTQNDLIRQSIIANRLRQSSYVPVGPNSDGITPPDTTTGATTTGDGDGGVNTHTVSVSPAAAIINQDRFRGGENNTPQAGGFAAQDDAREQYGRKDGGRIGYFFGGLAARGMKR